MPTVEDYLGVFGKPTSQAEQDATQIAVDQEQRQKQGKSALDQWIAGRSPYYQQLFNAFNKAGQQQAAAQSAQQQRAMGLQHAARGTVGGSNYLEDQGRQQVNTAAAYQQAVQNALGQEYNARAQDQAEYNNRISSLYANDPYSAAMYQTLTDQLMGDRQQQMQQLQAQEAARQQQQYIDMLTSQMFGQQLSQLGQTMGGVDLSKYLTQGAQQPAASNGPDVMAYTQALQQTNQPIGNFYSGLQNALGAFKTPMGV